jgi:hypothetical protein
MRTESAQSHAKKCIDRAEREKDTCHWRVVRNYFLKKSIRSRYRNGAAPARARAASAGQRVLCITAV